ncbi:hypothetical protein [Winogradskyella alexanderae]|uniref:DUF1772 domain-containing protein n=1 Tax=Winogradskyella alexanderae TaxID=2877123 RepID=A0ABS7XPC2_9FLAO|nr:hypothetical protein [Winogradskyella alexanderae]MCA0131851.1 hypothetical protein [Winogradskyella alexanderae]
MSLDLARLIIDFGFMILIWAVQLVIYPSFGFYNETNLIQWHKKYTKRVTVIVLPLMTAQLILALIQVFQKLNWYSIVSILIIGVLWLITFKVFVPLHMSIDLEKPEKNVCSKLVNKNWVRTFLWSSLFIISLVYYLFFQK